jgi:hypothetical protein
MTADTIAISAAVVLSLAFSYIPRLNPWFEKLEPTVKRLIMLCLLLVVSIAAFGLACAGWGDSLGLNVVCDEAGAWSLIRALVLAIIANQSIYNISPRTAAHYESKKIRQN